MTQVNSIPYDHTPVSSVGFLATLTEQQRGQALGILKGLLYSKLDQLPRLIRKKTWVVRDFSLLDQGVAKNYAVNGDLPLCGVGLEINDTSNTHGTQPVVFLYKASEGGDVDTNKASPMRILTPRQRDSVVAQPHSFVHQTFFVQLFWLNGNQTNGGGETLLVFPSSLITE